MPKTNWLPEGNSVVSPYILAKDIKSVLAFAREAFGAVDSYPPMEAPDGSIGHAQLTIGDSCVMFGDAKEAWPAMPCMIHVYVENADALYAKALKAGATSLQEPTNQFYGDRSAGVRDLEGNMWWIATHIEDVAHDEIARRAAAQGK